MFAETMEDMPLFSGAGIRAQEPTFAPPPSVTQGALPGLEITPDEVRAADRAKRLKRKKPKAAPPGQAELFQRVDPTKTQRFQRWSRGAEVKDEGGRAKVLYHGTMSDFSAFDIGRSNPESFFGAGFYFTDSADDVSLNYARWQGPDIDHRLEELVEQIHDEFYADPEPYLEALAELRGTTVEALEELDHQAAQTLEGGIPEPTDEEARAIAQRLLGDHDGSVIPAYVRMENPLYLSDGRYDATRFTGELVLDDMEGLLDEIVAQGDATDLDEARQLVEWRELDPLDYGWEERIVLTDETGRQMDLLDAVERASWDHGIDPAEVMVYLDEHLGWIGEWYRMTGEELRQALLNAPPVLYLEGEWYGEWRLMAHQFTQDVFRNLGYDGVVMHADEYFEPMMRQTGVGDYPVHYIAFEETQAKSVFAAHFDPDDPVLLHQEYSRNQYNQLLEQKGAGEPPSNPGMTRQKSRVTREGLEEIRKGFKKDLPKWRSQQLSQQTQKDVWEWFNKQVMPEWFDTRAIAMKYAKLEADRALLNYRDYMNFDLWLSYVVPYHYWFTRTAWNWAQRLPSRPGILAAYQRSRAYLQKQNEEAGRRQRFERKIEVPAPWLPDWMGDSLYVDAMRSVVPFANLGGYNWDDSDEAQTGLRKLWNTIERAGFRPFHFLELPYQAGWLSKAAQAVGVPEDVAQAQLAPEYPDFSFALPQLQLLRNVTAGASWAPPAGINVEGPVRRAAGLPAGETWEPYQVGRMLGNLAAEHQSDPDRARATLDAKELMDRDVNQDQQTWSADSELALQVAQELNWSPERLAAAQSMLSLAMTRAAKERLVKSIGWLTGPSLSIEPAGERAQLEMAEEARGTIWREDQPEGSLAAYQEFKRNHPAMYTRAAQYKMPGQEEYTGMGPGARANWMLQQEAKEQINAEYNQALDDYLRSRPWDLAGAYAGNRERRAQRLEELKTMYPLPPMEGEMPAIYYGMNPSEMWDAVVEDTLWDLQAAEPQADQFLDTSGEVQWDRYNQAQESWRANLPQLGEIQGGTYAGMDAETAYRTFEQRHHTPVQAMAYTYRDNVKNPAWTYYNRLKSQGETAGAAYQASVARVGPMPATALIPAILRDYRGKAWTREQLEAALAGIWFPALGDQKKTGEGVGVTATETAGGGGGGYSGRYYRKPRGGGGGGGSRSKKKLAKSSERWYPRWKPPPSIQGGPFRSGWWG
jgi:hypothetical protein